VTHENALHVEDVLMRRTRLFIEAADGGAGAAADVALIMDRLLGWSRRRRAAETRRYLELLEAERVVPGAIVAEAPTAAAEPALGTLAAAR
jgi:glycerol-3-phosphate dehydrogenase